VAIPDNVYQALKDAKSAWDSLYVTVPQNKANWTPEQLKALGAQAEVLKHTYNALNRLIAYLDQ
jgi:hypothetical protein